MTFGDRIQRLRKEMGISQEELADRLGVTRQTISKWELNQSTPELECISQLSSIYQVTTDYLIKGVPAPPKTESAAFASQAAVQEKSSPEERLRYGSLFLLGLVLFSLGMVGMLVFAVLASVDPWTAIVGRYAYEGLLGYLIGTDSLPYFLLLLLMSAAGLSMAIYGIVKKRR